MSTQRIEQFGTSAEPMERIATEALIRYTVKAIVTDEKEFSDELVFPGHEGELKIPVKEYLEY